MSAEPSPTDATDVHARLTALFDELADLPEDEQKHRLAAVDASDPLLAPRLRALLDADRATDALLDRDAQVLASDLADDDGPAAMPQRFGHYVIAGYLGEGGMGAVYLARRDGLGDLVAVKFLSDAWSPAARERFALEQRTLASLNHPAIARLYDVGVSDERPWFAMEYVPGQTVVAHARSRGLDLAGRLRLVRAAGDAVSYAHRNLVVHLDLKPSNILVGEDGAVKLVDFGVARHLDSAGDAVGRTATGHRRLSMNYASPEQIRGEALDVQSDVHGLGAVMYELLAGTPPVSFASLSPLEMTRALTAAPPHPSSRADTHPEASVRATRAQWQDLDAICLRAVHRDKDERYASVEAFLHDIDRFERQEPLDARTTATSAYRLRKFLRRNRRSLAITAAVAAALVAIVIGFTLRLVAARDAAIASRTQLERIHGLMLNLFEGDDDAAGPAGGLRVAALLDRGVQEAEALNDEPRLQAELRSTFGGLYHKLGRIDRAGPLLTAALDAQRSHLGAADPETLRTQLALARLRIDESEYDEAERLAREALKTARERPVPDAIEIATARSVLGQALADRGNYREAVTELSAAVDVLSRRPPSTELSEALGSLANAEYYLGHPQATYDLNVRGLALDRQLFGERHPHVGVDLFNLANLALDRGDYAGAEQQFGQALAINEDWYGPDHPKTAQTVLMRGRSLAYQQRYEEAAPLYERARTIFTETYGPRHVRVAVAETLIGDLARDRGRLADAETAFRDAAAIFKASVGEQHEFYQHQRSNLASLQLARGEFAAAESTLRDVVARMRSTSPQQRYTAIAELRLARALAGQRRWSEARSEAVAATERLRGVVGPDAAELVEARATLADIEAGAK